MSRKRKVRKKGLKQNQKEGPRNYLTPATVMKIYKSFNSNSSDSFIMDTAHSYLEHIPKKLYRYRPATYDKEHGNRDLLAIADSKIWFSSPKNFNDPFDCSFNINVDKMLKELISQEFSELTLPSLSRMAGLEQDIQKLSQELSQDIQELGSEFRIACLSEASDSILMWSHYANSHSGICVEYDTESLIMATGDLFFPVSYSNTLPTIDLKITDEKEDDFAAFSFVLKRLLTKATPWSYEKEWRAIHSEDVGQGDNPSGTLINSLAPTAIYLGCKADERLKHDIKDYCRGSHVQAYQMKVCNDKFSLKSVPIPLDK